MMDNQMKQYEMQEAKKRMGTYTGNAANAGAGMTNTVGAGMTNTAGTGMTNTTGSNTNMTSQAQQLKGSEKVKAQEDMNQMY
ncbi:hypothetical protein R9X47_07465 [Wukongibacter baidiensis]|uniref:hypothetical protein n=1 Tax=Wukongibacter baidiensis TaxID=1723361 RepID=UPI003D7F6F91